MAVDLVVIKLFLLKKTGCNALSKLKHGKYLESEALLKEIYEQGDIVRYTCDFDNKLVGQTKCDGGRWSKTPFCPEAKLQGLFFDQK